MLHEQHRAAVGRKLGRRALSHAPRGAARSLHRPDRALGAVGIRCRIRDPAGTVRLRAAAEHHGAAVVRNADLRDVRPVVLHEVRQADGGERRRGRGIGVPSAFFVDRPRNAVHLLRRDELERVGIAQKALIQRRLRRRGRLDRRSGKRQHDDQRDRAVTSDTHAFLPKSATSKTHGVDLNIRQRCGGTAGFARYSSRVPALSTSWNPAASSSAREG